jgi:hypothetical protein
MSSELNELLQLGLGLSLGVFLLMVILTLAPSCLSLFFLDVIK